MTLARPSIARASLMAMPRDFKPVDHAQGQAAVDRLMFADQRHGQVLELAVGRRQADAVVRAEHPAGFEAIAEFDRLAGDIQRRTDFLGNLLQRRFGLGILHDADGGDAGLEDAGLFRRRCGQGRAQAGPCDLC